MNDHSWTYQVSPKGLCMMNYCNEINVYYWMWYYMFIQDV